MVLGESGLLVPNRDRQIIIPEGYGDDNTFDIKRLMDEAVDPLTGTIRDLRLDDRDLPLAPNFFTYTTQFSRANPPWARQMMVYSLLFGEICPVCTNKRYMRVDGLPPDYPTRDLPEHVQFMNHGVCPKCKGTRGEFLNNKVLQLYNELVLVWGQRSGKSTSGMKAVAYLIHRLLKFPKISNLAPTEILPSSPLTGTFISLTFSRAVSLLWVPLLNELADTPWFDDYYSFLDDHGERYGVELYRKKDLFLKFFHKNYHFYPSHPNAGILRGDTRVLGAVDELGLFKPPRKVTNEDEGGSSERANAREAIESLTSSMATVGAVMSRLIRLRGMHHSPMTMMFGLSSPKSERDMVMERLRLALGEGKFFILGSHLPTWEVNPNLPRDCEFIRSKFTADATAAMRDFGAQPPKVSSTAIHKSIYTGRRNPFTGPKNAIRAEYEYSITDKEVWCRLTNALEGKYKYNTATIIDAGYNDNSFSITSVGMNPETGKVCFPAIVEVIPRDGYSVNFNRLYKEAILPFIKATRGQLLVADRWNSLDLLHRARDDVKGLSTLQHSLRRPDFDEFLQVMSNGNMEFPFLEQTAIDDILTKGVEDYRIEMTNRPVEHLLLQLSTIQDMGPMAMPDKADGYTDDVLRTIILGTWTILNPKYYGVIMEGRVKYASKTSSVVGTYRSRS